MANVLVQDTSLQNIADAIRSKNGTQNTYKPSQMADAITNIPSGGITPTGTINITANGTHDVTNYASAEVNVPAGSEPSLGTKSITANGTYTASDDGIDGYSEVTVNVPTGTTPTGTKQISITQNGTTTEDVSAYANAEITVNVSSGGVSVETGTFTMNSDTTVAASGTIVNVGFSGQPDMIVIWLDADDFAAISSPSNGRWYKFALVKKESSILSTIPTVRISNTTSLQGASANADYILSVAPTVAACSASANGQGIPGMSYSNSNVGVNKINADGTIKVARYSSTATVILAGTYHYVAITGANFGLLA